MRVCVEGRVCKGERRMENILEGVYTAAYIAGKMHHPIYFILGMPSRQGKSLTSYRFFGDRAVLLAAGDTTTNTFRKTLHEHYKGNILKEVNLTIIEDWSKIREKVQEGLGAILTMLSTTMLSIDQEGLDVPPTKVYTSVVINCPEGDVRSCYRTLQKVGAGNRFFVIKTQLTEDNSKELNKLGLLNMDKRLLPLRINTTKTLNWKEFVTFYLDTEQPIELINLAYACAHIEEGLFKEILDLNANPIKNISWRGYWEDE